MKSGYQVLTKQLVKKILNKYLILSNLPAKIFFNYYFPESKYIPPLKPNNNNNYTFYIFLLIVLIKHHKKTSHGMCVYQPKYIETTDAPDICNHRDSRDKTSSVIITDICCLHLFGELVIKHWPISLFKRDADKC